MPMPKIKEVRAYTVRGGGADYHDQADGHWIDDHIATPMARYPEYRQSRQSFGINVLGTLVVEVEARRRHGRLRRHDRRRDRRLHRREAPRPFPRGARRHRHREDLGPDVLLDAVLRPQGHGAERHLRRRPRALGPAGQDPAGAGVSLLGGPVRDELPFYATGARPDLAKQMGFIGGKMPLAARPGRGRRGAAEEPRQARGHAREGRRRLLADVRLLDEPRPRTTPPGWPRGARVRAEVDRGGAAPRTTTGAMPNCAAACRAGMLVTTGEHEATRWGFRMLLEMGCCDIIQPDVGLVRRHHRADQDFRAGGRARRA